MKILKANETGRGILVEYDAGYISPDLSYKGTKNFDLIREFKSGTNIEKDGSLPDKIIVYAVLQKWGIENKNGRIYPKEILEKLQCYLRPSSAVVIYSQFKEVFYNHSFASLYMKPITLCDSLNVS